MRIDDCYMCGEPVHEGTLWELSSDQGFLCEKCNVKNQLTNEAYHANAVWLKSLSKKGAK